MKAFLDGVVTLLNNRRVVSAAVIVVVAISSAFGLSCTESQVQGQVDTWTQIGVPVVTAIVAAVSGFTARKLHPNQE